MKESSSDLDTLLRKARHAAEPGPQTRSRVQAALLARIAAGDLGPPDGASPAEATREPEGSNAPPDGARSAGPAPSHGSSPQGATQPTPQAPAQIATKSLASKAGLVVGVVGALGLLTALVLSKGGEVEQPPVAAGIASAPASPVGEGSASSALVQEQAPPVASAIASAPGSSQAPGATSRAGAMTRSTDTLDLLREETAQLRQAQQALRGGQAARAMAMLDEQNRLFARGVLGQERMVTRILALCALGRRGEAQRLGADLERSSPRSPHLATLRNSCARQEPDQRGSTEREVTP